MKYFFGTDRTRVKAKDEIKTFFDKGDEAQTEFEFDGKIFITEKLPSSYTQKVTEQIEDFSDEVYKKTKLPWWMQILRYGSLLACMVFARFIFDEETQATVFETIKTQPWLLIGLIICLAVCVLTFLFEHKKAKDYSQSDEAELSSRKTTALLDSAYRQLGVPENADDTEILISSYKIKNGEIKRKKIAFWNFSNSSVKAWTQDKKLCIADLSARFEIPIAKIKCIHYRKEKILLPSWDKEEPFKSEKYKKYGIKENDNGIVLKGYYAAVVEHENEIYELHFPPYEIETYSKLIGTTGLSISKQP